MLIDLLEICHMTMAGDPGAAPAHVPGDSANQATQIGPWEAVKRHGLDALPEWHLVEQQEKRSRERRGQAAVHQWLLRGCSPSVPPRPPPISLGEVDMGTFHPSIILVDPQPQTASWFAQSVHVLPTMRGLAGTMVPKGSFDRLVVETYMEGPHRLPHINSCCAQCKPRDHV